MTGIEIFFAVLGGIGTICAIVFGLLAFKRNERTDHQQDGKESGMIMSELGYIRSGVDDVKRKQEKQQEKQEEQHIEVVQRLSAVEQSAKQAHHRIDSLEHSRQEVSE